MNEAKMLKKAKQFIMLSIFSQEHCEDESDEKNWIKYQFLDSKEKGVITSPKMFEEFKEWLIKS